MMINLQFSMSGHHLDESLNPIQVRSLYYYEKVCQFLLRDIGLFHALWFHHHPRTDCFNMSERILTCLRRDPNWVSLCVRLSLMDQYSTNTKLLVNNWYIYIEREYWNKERWSLCCVVNNPNFIIGLLSSLQQTHW